MDTSRLLLLISVALLALAALIAAGIIAYAHQRRERSSQVLQSALDRAGAGACSTASAGAGDVGLSRARWPGLATRTEGLVATSATWVKSRIAS